MYITILGKIKEDIYYSFILIIHMILLDVWLIHVKILLHIGMNRTGLALKRQCFECALSGWCYLSAGQAAVDRAQVNVSARCDYPGEMADNGSGAKKPASLMWPGNWPTHGRWSIFTSPDNGGRRGGGRMVRV